MKFDLNSASGSWDEQKLEELLKEINDFNMDDFGDFSELEQELIEIEDDYEKQENSDNTNNHNLKLDKFEIPLDENEYKILITKFHY